MGVVTPADDHIILSFGNHHLAPAVGKLYSVYNFWHVSLEIRFNFENELFALEKTRKYSSNSLVYMLRFKCLAFLPGLYKQF